MRERMNIRKLMSAWFTAQELRRKYLREFLRQLYRNRCHAVDLHDYHSCSKGACNFSWGLTLGCVNIELFPWQGARNKKNLKKTVMDMLDGLRSSWSEVHYFSLYKWIWRAKKIKSNQIKSKPLEEMPVTVHRSNSAM